MSLLSSAVSMSIPDAPDPASLQAENNSLKRQVFDLTAALGRLKETSDMYRMVADTTADAILCADGNLELVYANPSAGTLLKIAPRF